MYRTLQNSGTLRHPFLFACLDSLVGVSVVFGRCAGAVTPLPSMDIVEKLARLQFKGGEVEV